MSQSLYFSPTSKPMGSLQPISCP